MAGSDGNRRVVKPLLGQEGIIPELTEAKVTGLSHNASKLQDSGKISARGTPNISKGVADSEVINWNKLIPWQ
jgi:hypothetical protein